MPLSKERDKLRQRIRRGTVLPSPTTDLALMPLYKRQEKLAELIGTPIQPDKVNAGHVIAAIQEANKMEGSYAPIKHLVAKRVELEITYVKREAISPVNDE